MHSEHHHIDNSSRRPLAKNSARDTVNWPVGGSALPTPAPLLENTPVDFSPEIELLTVAEASQLLAISVSTVRRLQQARRIPFIKVGGALRFAKTDLLAYLNRRRVESIGQ